MMSRYHKLAMLLIMCCIFMSACSQRPASTADVPRHLSATYRIAVAPFTQPLEPGQLLTGQIPEDQGIAPQDVLLALDMDLRDALMTQTKRQFDFIPRANLHKELNITHSTAQPGAIQRWVSYGTRHGAQYLLVPQVLNWKDREGSQAGVSKSAHCRVEFFLINIKDGLVTARSVFEEKQVGLVDDLLQIGKFIKRKGQWVSARDLAVEGMTQAIKEMGL